MTDSYKTELRSQDLKVALVWRDMSSDDSSFHNFIVLGKSECRCAEVLVLGWCSAIQ